MAQTTERSRRTPRRWQLSRCIAAALLAPPSLVLAPAAVAQSVWEGTVSTDITDPDNWSGGSLLDNQLVINGAVNNPIWNMGDSPVDPSLGLGYLQIFSLEIGNAAGATGHLVINGANDASINQGNIYFAGSSNEALIIGSNGGTGILDFNLHPTSAPGTQLELFDTNNDGGLSVGKGVGSNGTVNILGSGKATNQQTSAGASYGGDFSGGMHWWLGSHVIGSEGGTGTVNVIDAGWVTQSAAQDVVTGLPTASLSIGVDAGSGGTVNVLSGGKLSVSATVFGPEPAAVIGGEGGTGTLNVSGVNANNYASNATLGVGLDVGRGSGSTGNVNVLAGGKMLNYTPHGSLQGSTDLPPVQLGLDGGSGQATVSGAGSIWYVGGTSEYNYRGIDHVDSGNNYEYLTPITDGTEVGNLHVGVSGTGALTIADGGVVTLGTAYTGTISEYYGTGSAYYYALLRFDDGLGTLYLGETATGSGSLNIGAAAGAVAVAPGELRAAQVVMGAGTSNVVFNHTATDYVFDTPLVGAGTLSAYAGTTWLQLPGTAVAGAAADNSGFSGPTNLYGGALGLGYSAALGTSGVQVLANAGLIYGDGVDIANLIDLQGTSALTVSALAGTAGTQAGVISGSGSLVKQDAGTVVLTGVETYTGQTTISAGTLALSGAGSIATSSKVWDDGIFDVSAATSEVFIRSLAGAGTANLGAQALSLTAAEDTFAGQFTGTGTFSVLAGNEVLTGDSSAFAGATQVAGGELWVNGVLGNSATTATVASGALLGGSGTLGGNVDVLDGGILVPGPEASVPGELTIAGNLSLAPTSTMRFLFGQSGVAGGAYNDLLTVGGNLTLDGVLEVSEAAGGAFEPGAYRVIDYAGTLDDRGLSLGTLPADLAGLQVQNSVANQVNLVLAPSGTTLSFWDGAAGPKDDGHIDGGDGVWQASGGNNNWTDANGMLNAPFADGSFAVFEGAPGTVIVDGSLGAIQVDGMQFTTSGYVVKGDAIELLGPDAFVRVGVSSRGRSSFLTRAVEFTTTLDSVLTGDARLVKTDAGTLILNGANTYIGGTFIRDGVLQVASDAALGASSGALEFGFAALRTTASMESARAISIDTGATLLPTAGTTLTLSGAISGSGALFKAEDGLLRLTGNSPLTGATTVAVGELKVDGSLASSAVAVRSGAMLSGNGTVGATTIQSGGIVAPGSSIGTLFVAGDYTQVAGSLYRVEVDPASSASDLVSVSGAATLADGAQLQVVRNSDLPYRPGTRYTVLTATGGVTGDYALSGDTAVSAFLSLTDTYDANNAYLEVSQIASPGDLACVPNAHAAAGGAAGLAVSGDLNTALLNQPDATTACDALGQLSGELHASLRGALLEDSRFLREAVGNRLRGAAEDGVAVDRQNAADAANGVWAHVFGSWGRFDHGRQTDALGRDIGGLFVGADLPLAGDWRLGVVGGYSRSDMDVDAWRSSAKSDDSHLGLYAGSDWDNGVSLQGGLGYTRHSIKTTRRIDFAYFSDRPRADYDASTRQVFAELAYRFQPGQVALQPFLNLAYVQVDTDGFQEQGGEAALAVADQRDDLTYAVLGMRGSRVFDTRGGAKVTLRAMTGWQRVFGDRDPSLPVAFVAGDAFSIAGVPLARNALAAELGVDAALRPNLRLGFTYSGRLGAGIDDHGAKAYLEWNF